MQRCVSTTLTPRSDARRRRRWGESGKTSDKSLPVITSYSIHYTKLYEHRLVVDRIDPERYLLLLETGDEVLDWREAARKYEGARAVVRDGGDHTMQSFPEHLPRILAFAGIDTD